MELPKAAKGFDRQRAETNLPPLPYHNLSRLMQLAADGHLESVQNEIRDLALDPFNSKWHERESCTPLDMAASSGQINVVQYLTENFQSWTHYGNEAICEAAKNGQIEIVECLARNFILDDILAEHLAINGKYYKAVLRFLDNQRRK